MTKPLSPRVRERRLCMLSAHLLHNAHGLPLCEREFGSWLLLLEWARLGGTPDEVIA